MLDKLYNILSFIIPHSCYICQKTGRILCRECQKRILATTKVKPLNYRKLAKSDQFFVIGAANGWLKKLIYDYKHNARREYAEIFAEIIEEFLRTERRVVVPIPTIKKSRRQRGFGHMELIARKLTRFGHQYQPVLCNSSTVAQKDLNLKGRAKNAENLSCTVKLDPEAWYLVIDDLTTSGSTLKRARKVMLQAGAKNVVCLALAHA